MNQMRRAITQSQANAKLSVFLVAEFVITALIVGILFDSSTIGIAVFFSLFVGVFIPYVGLLVMVIFIIFWAVFFFTFGWQVGGLFGCALLGVVGTFFMLGIHMAGFTGLFDAVP